MRRNRIATLPLIAVEERPEKYALTVPQTLKHSIDDFKELFVATTGSTPTSDNAVLVGILTGYLDAHASFQRWLKTKARGPEAKAP